MKKALSALVGSSLLLIAGAASAQGGQWSGSYSPSMPSRSSGLDNLGEEFQVVFGVDRTMGLAIDSWKVEGSGTTATNKSTSFSLFGAGAGTSMIPRFGLDFFVTEGVSVGGSLFFSTQSTKDEIEAGGTTNESDGPKTTTFGFAPRVGYAMPFDETFSFWPRAGITYLSRSVTVTDTTTNTESKASQSALDFTVEAMFGISPFSHFAMLVGPYLDLGLSGSEDLEPGGGAPKVENDAKLTSFGIAVSVLGYY